MELLIVDDEETARQAVLMHVDWKALPFEEIHTAPNIAKAKGELENKKIKVVLCDIEMPMGSGLELLEWINGNRKDVVCIFMTCHAEFSYAQKAIQLGSMDYVLKPLDFESLTDTLKKAAGRVEERSQMNRTIEEGRKNLTEQFWMKLFSGDLSANRTEISRYIEENGLDISADGRFLPVMAFSQNRNDNFSTEDKKIQLFALKNACREIFAGLNTKLMTETMADGNILLIYEILTELEEQKIFEEVYHRCEVFQTMAEQYLQMNVTSMVGRICGVEEVPEQIEKVYSMIYYSMRYRGRTIIDSEKSYYQMAEGEELVEPEKEQTNQFVRQVKEFVEQNIREELSVEDLAGQVHLNVDYLNRIFKKETGSTLGNYVTSQKMERAKFLLLKTDWSIGDVAAAVGYYNYSSFNRSFKKMTGESPQEWRKRR